MLEEQVFRFQGAMHNAAAVRHNILLNLIGIVDTFLYHFFKSRLELAIDEPIAHLGE